MELGTVDLLLIMLLLLSFAIELSFEVLPTFEVLLEGRVVEVEVAMR